MKDLIKIVSIIGLTLIAQTAYTAEITDTYNTGDTLTATTLKTIKDAVNDNDTGVNTLQGDVTALQAPKLKSVVISSAAFVPESGDVDYSRAASGNGILRLSTTGLGDWFLAPVLLPAGVTITNIEMYTFDGVNPGAVQVEIFSNELPLTALAGSTVTTTDAEIGGEITLTSGAINYTIPSDVGQWIHLRAFISRASSSLGLYAVKINYTYSP